MKQSQKPLPYYLEDFLDWLVHKRGLTLKTQENYGRFLVKFFSWLELHDLSFLKPHELTLSHLDEYHSFLSSENENLKPSTQNYYLIALRSLLTYFVEYGISSVSPEEVKLLGSVSIKKPHFLSFLELQKLLEKPDVSTIRGLRDRAMMELLLSAGFRVSELAQLNRSFSSGDQFSEQCRYWLQRYLETRLDNHEALFINYQSPKNVSRRLSVRSIQKIMKRYALQAGLPENITPHVLRHTQAQNLLVRSVDAKPLHALYRHSQIFSNKSYVKPIGFSRVVVSQSQEGFLWHDVEKRIQEEIRWLQEIIPTFLPKEKHTPDGCSHCFLRCLATLIVQGVVSAVEIRSNGARVSFWEARNDFSPIKIYHGKDWHRITMSRIESHFLARSHQVVRQPTLQQGRTDLGVSDFGGMDVFIEIGTVSLYKLMINFLTMNNFIYLIAPHEGVLIEFTKKQKQL